MKLIISFADRASCTELCCTPKLSYGYLSHMTRNQARHDSTDIMVRLREETRAEHEHTEEAVNIPAKVANPDTYRKLLEKFHGFHVGIEACIAAGTDVFLKNKDAVYINKLVWLRQDLQVLGLDEKAISSLPVCGHLPHMANAATLMGCIYVMEGSMLGGQVILRMISESLQLDKEHGARFFYGYGPETGKRWRNFGDLARQLIPSDQHPETIQAAKETFHTFTQWMRA